MLLGRTDLGVDPATVETAPRPPGVDLDDYENSISRQFAYFVRNARTVRLLTELAYKLKKNKDWGLNKELVAYNVAFHRWPDELPQDLNISFPADGSVPKLASHFIANVHCHYHLAIVMLRRPQLSASQNFEDDSWKEHLRVSYESARKMCRIQEGIIAQWEFNGLLYMQRGINFTIYAIVTCVMIHLIAICSPEPEFNADAREYFVRHMRILEQCVSAWPMPETEAQINGLRAAFSADLSKPFELRSSFPMGSPGDMQPSPPNLTLPSQGQYQDPQMMQQAQQTQRQHLMIPPYANQQVNQMQQQASYLATPPVSAVSNDSKAPSPQTYHDYELQSQNFLPISQNNYYQTPVVHEQPQWNPAPIIDQFSTAFAIPASALAPPSAYGSSPPNQVPSSAGGYTSNPSPPFATATYPPQQPQHQAYYHHQQKSHQPHVDTTNAANMTAHMQQQPTPQSANPYMSAGTYVTPRQWQQSVASVFDPAGLKRRWDAR